MKATFATRRPVATLLPAALLGLLCLCAGSAATAQTTEQLHQQLSASLEALGLASAHLVTDHRAAAGDALTTAADHLDAFHTALNHPDLASLLGPGAKPLLKSAAKLRAAVANARIAVASPVPADLALRSLLRANTEARKLQRAFLNLPATRNLLAIEELNPKSTGLYDAGSIVHFRLRNPTGAPATVTLRHLDDAIVAGNLTWLSDSEFRLDIGPDAGAAILTATAAAQTSTRPVGSTGKGNKKTSPPTAPSQLTATALNHSQIQLAWVDASSNETGFKIERSVGATGTWTQIAIVSSNITAYTNTGLQPDTLYAYRVRSYNSAGNSAYSATATATTLSPPDTTAPTTPTGPVATPVSSSQIHLTWNPSTDTGGSGLAGYHLYRDGTLIADTTSTDHNDTGLAPATQYCYTVAAYDNAGNASAQSGPACATTPAPPDTTPPSVPTGLVATAVATNQINLTWNASSDTGGSGLAGYRVYRGGVLIATVSTTSYSDTGRAPATQYCYTVAAYDNAGNASAQSGPACATTPAPPDTTPPSVPTGLVATAVATNQINLTWNASSDTGGSGLAGYRVYRGGVLIATVSTTSYSDTGRAPATQYCYTVAAYDNAGNASAHSGPACATTPSAPDTTPPTVTLTAPVNGAIVSNTIAITATASDNVGVTRVEFYRDGGVILGTNSSAPYSLTFDTRTISNGPCTFYAKAYDAAGNQATSAGNVVTVQNALAPPVGQPELVGFLPALGVTRGVTVGGSRVYAACDVYGLTVIDVGTPSAPRVLGTSDLPFDGTWIAGTGALVVVTGTRTYHSAPGVPKTVNGLYVLNATNAAAPRLVGMLETNSALVLKGVAVAGHHAYVACGGAGLRVFDLSNPSAPVIVGAFDTPGFAQTVAVAGPYAYVADDAAGLRILNISDPSSPTSVGVVDTPGLASDVAVAGSYAYVADANALQVIDVSQPTAPVIRGAYAMSAAFQVRADGSTAYVGASGAGLVMINCSNPSAPAYLGAVLPIGAPDASTVGVAVQGGYAYVANRTGGLAVVNVGNPSSPTTVGQLMDWFAGFKMAGRPGLVVVTGTKFWNGGRSSVNGVRILEVSNPAVPVVLSSLDVSNLVFKGVALAGQHAVIACGAVGIRVLDIANPTAPVIVGALDTPGFAQSVAVAGNYAYVADDAAGLQVVDIRNPAAPVWVGTVDTPGLASEVTVAGNLAYVADANALQVVDVTNPAAPVIRGGYPLSAAFEVTVAGNIAFVAGSGLGMVLLDVSNPANPTWLSRVLPVGATDASTVGLSVSGNTAYVANRTGGLAVVDISNPVSPVLRSTVLTIGDARAVLVDGNWAYVADSLSVLNTIRLP